MLYFKYFWYSVDIYLKQYEHHFLTSLHVVVLIGATVHCVTAKGLELSLWLVCLPTSVIEHCLLLTC